MQATKPKPTSTRKSKFQSIPGALSLYRAGDRITFELNGVEFCAPVEFVELKDRSAVVYVTVAVGVFAHHVKRVERRAS